MFAVNIIAGAQGNLYTCFVRMGKQRYFRCAEHCGCHHIWICTVHINFIHQPFGCYVCKPQSVAVSMCLICQIQNRNVLDFNALVNIRNSKPSCYVGVHAISADIFANPVHQQNVDVVKINLSQPLFGGN